MCLDVSCLGTSAEFMETVRAHVLRGEEVNRSEAIELMVSRAHITEEQAEKALAALLEGIDEIVKQNGGATLAEFEAEVAAKKRAAKAKNLPAKRISEVMPNNDEGPWDRIWALAGSVSRPPDWARNHDEYLREAREPLK